MCYAIPGKVLEINNNTALIEYFGEKKTALVDAGNIRVGDYVYAQGGFIVQALEADEAHGILNEWEEIFFKLKERDEMLAGKISPSVSSESDIEMIIAKGEAGAQLTKDELGVLFRFETSNRDNYSKLHTTLHYDDRLRTLQIIRDTGYIIATGSLIGLPGHGEEDILNDVLLANSFGTEMYSFGPFIAHPQTPLASVKTTDLDTMLKVIAVTRLVHHDGNLLVTSAVETLFGREGAEKALMAGGNSMMINLTPDRYRKLYSIYPGKGEKDKDIPARISETISLLYALGRDIFIFFS